MTDESVHSEEHADHGGLGVYLAVFLALCFLTACSFWTYSDYWPKSLDSDSIKRTFMMAVSCLKALLVALFFMHLKWEANWKWVLTVPASMMSIFLMLMLVPDIGLRMRHASEERLLHAAETPAGSGGLAPRRRRPGGSSRASSLASIARRPFDVFANV